MTIGEMSIAAYLNALASKQSTPGGGGAAALTGSQAAALLSMVINFTLGNKKYADVHAVMTGHLAASEQLRRQLLALADEDAVAFEAVSAVYAMPKETEVEKTARGDALQAALIGAARVPMATAERCLDVLRLAEPVAAQGNSNVVSDAATAIYLADAALRAAVVNVNINLKFIKDEGFVTRAAIQRDALLMDAAAAIAAGKVACQRSLGIDL
ncbi:MAG: cyclodeaminase/cyclohydrolase family protein [Caldilineaceae bacterium]|nr:cyclodeaminase/cyclohydrolase family protein [Caldilineaceae bacterium]